MRLLGLVAVLLAGLPALADGQPEVDVYAFCDASPRVDAPPARPLSLTVTRHSPGVELLSVAVRPAGDRALQAPAREDRAGLPGELRLWYPPPLCRGALDVQVTVREVATGKVRQVASRVAVQQVQ